MAHAVFAAPMVFRGASSAARLTRDRDSRSSRRDVTTGASVSSRSSFVFPKREWAHMTTAEFEGVDKTRLIALLPVGAIEQHGPHLPVCVDAAINAGVLARAMELLPDDLPVCVLPPVPYGKSVEHDSFCGTLSLSAATLTAVWTDIGDSLHRAGVQKLVLFNAHGGQPQVMDIVARDLRKRHGMLVVTLSWFSFGLPESMFSDTELKHGLHAGDVETSVMLHLHPTLVQMDKARNFKSAGEVMEKDFQMLAPEGSGVGFGWLAEDLNASGATGDASGATKEKGRATVEHAAHKLVELLTEGTYWPFPNLGTLFAHTRLTLSFIYRKSTSSTSSVSSTGTSRGGTAG
jgi:creatinine amidohydrolase